jgi:hypothetical protein
MKKALIAALVSVSLTAISVGGYALAQDNPERQQNRPANERMEKGNPAQGAQRPNNPSAARNDDANAAKRDEPQTGQANQRRDEPRTGEATEKREQPRTGEATEKREQPRMGEAIGKREEPRTGQATEKREQPRTGQANEKRDDTRNGQTATSGESERNDSGGRAGNVRVNGNLHVSEGNAARISENLMRRGPSENINVHVDVGAPLPGNVDLLPLPPDVVALAPEYEGYDYVVVNDEIVFVQPSTRKVVGMIVAEGGEPDRHIAAARPCPID